MRYSQTYINNLLNQANQCIAKQSAYIDNQLRLGKKLCKEEKELRELYYATWALSRWNQDAEGTSYANNPIDLSGRDTLINAIQQRCCGYPTSNNSQSSGVVTIPYWEDGYSVGGYTL